MGWLADLLKEVPLSTIIKERLTHEEKLHDETKAKNVELQLQVDELTKEAASLKERLSVLEASEDYQERNGVLWKKDANGEFKDGPRCPTCKTVMHRIRSKTICSRCKFMVG